MHEAHKPGSRPISSTSIPCRDLNAVVVDDADEGDRDAQLLGYDFSYAIEGTVGRGVEEVITPNRLEPIDFE